ncbi:MAG TPA: hypothetical protein VIH15_03480 [Casimicrobiaceae bacterium]
MSDELNPTAVMGEGMRRTGSWLAAACGVLAAIGATPMPASGAGSESSGDGVLFPPATAVYPGTRAFSWTVRVPLLTIEQRLFVFKAPEGIARPQRWDYEGPAVRTERRKIGTYPEFSCKYVDWTVSNECRTVWRGVYADLPVVVMRPQHVVLDVPDWRWKTQTLPIAVPRWTWKEERWTISVPVVVTDPMDDPRGPRPDGTAAEAEIARAQSMLDAEQGAALAAFDDGLRTLDQSVAAVEARDADPRRLEASNGGTLDLVATRTALSDERAATLLHFRRIRIELDAATQAE